MYYDSLSVCLSSTLVDYYETATDIIKLFSMSYMIIVNRYIKATSVHFTSKM